MPAETNSREAIRLAKLERRIGFYAARRAAQRTNCFALFLIARVLEKLETRHARTAR